MVLSDVSIKRPVFATVMSLVLIIFGLFALRGMAVREYPDIDPPVVSVSTTYRGASAEIIESKITQIIEDSVAGIEGIRSITSSSREESSSVSIEFNLSRSVDAAANDVRDRVSRVLSRLPAEADTPTVAKTEADARPIVYLSLTSDRMSFLELTDYADRFLVDQFSIVDGVASVNIYGARKYAMRVYLDRMAMAARNVTVQEVESAIARQNVELPSGRVESSQREFTVRTESGLRTPEQFRNIVLRQQDGYLVRLGEVAKVELGAEDERSEQRTNAKPSIGLGIIRQSKANAMDISNGVQAALDRVKDSLPQGVNLEVTYDQSKFISQSIYEVFHALTVALGLVIGVIFLFLRSWRATLIPAVAIPVSVIGSFIVLGALGYSINVLTLLALVLAIGLVVDDAIVVLENIHRRIELGEPPLLASLRGARQIGFAVIATTVVLIAVFVPISLMEGNTGRLFREFGISVAASVLFSGFVALTLTPMMCSKLLHEAKDEGWFYKITEKFFVGMTNAYGWTLKQALNMPFVVLALGGVVSLAAYLMFLALPREFAPTEDRGVFFVSMTGPEGSSYDYTRRNVMRVEQVLQPLIDRGDVTRVLANVAPGWGGRPAPVNTGFIVVRLKDWHERTVKQQDLVREVFPRLLGITGVRAFAINPPSLGQSGSQAPVQFIIGGPTYATLDQWSERVMERALGNPNLLNLTKSYLPTRPEIRVEIDRNRAADLGVPIETIGRTMETMLGSREVTNFQREGKQYKVLVQARPEDRVTPSDLNNIYVRTVSGALIPLQNLVKIGEGANARELTRNDRLRSVTITASLTPDYTLGEALDYLEKVAAETLPPEARITYGGQSREFKDSSAAVYLTFALALVIVFLVLAGQFESWIHPVIIIFSVPLAITGALGALLFKGLSLNIYSQIGIIMLIGLIAKNAILIVEFANQLRDEGRDVRTAVQDSSTIRLRPILMTTIATIFGAMPLAYATGAGAESRSALGWVIVGGMSFATLLSLYAVPALYLLLAGFAKPAGFIARRLSDMDAKQPDVDAKHGVAE
ncbi:efflux RND transporter permease subunit [Ferrovibrio sp.]|uniref:efflux RND transporter permease subunit n=1 Tax=Ferrovibrio sp. TaxID=1917215 RepID=UPI0025BC733F|nr:efflux RND transporter permease subunit [Ferrovibrio sp.]MBX3453198.1 efflux RND transporter permease subunit [Ferrovibrio sp.]